MGDGGGFCRAGCRARGVLLLAIVGALLLVACGSAAAATFGVADTGSGCVSGGWTLGTGGAPDTCSSWNQDSFVAYASQQPFQTFKSDGFAGIVRFVIPYDALAYFNPTKAGGANCDWSPPRQRVTLRRYRARIGPSFSMNSRPQRPRTSR